jgi:hypothetical protein
MKLSPEGYFSEAIKFRSMEVPKIEQKILTRRMSKQKLRSIGSPERLVELSVYVIHIVEQLGIHVEGKKLKSRDGNTNHERVRPSEIRLEFRRSDPPPSFSTLQSYCI